MVQEKQQCSARVYNGAWRDNPCSRKATVIEDGKPYCVQHSPAKVAERRQAQDARYRADRDAADERRAKEAYDRVAGDLCRSLGLELEQLTKEELIQAIKENYDRAFGEG